MLPHLVGIANAVLFQISFYQMCRFSRWNAKVTGSTRMHLIAHVGDEYLETFLTQKVRLKWVHIVNIRDTLTKLRHFL